MSDGGEMDPCECIWGHEMLMRRLINLLRNSQSYCTDTECFDEGTTPPDNSEAPHNVLYFTVFMMAALFLYVFRPRPQRLTEGPSKPAPSGNDANGAPPSPPPSTA